MYLSWAYVFDTPRPAQGPSPQTKHPQYPSAPGQMPAARKLVGCVTPKMRVMVMVMVPPPDRAPDTFLLSISLPKGDAEVRQKEKYGDPCSTLSPNEQ